MRPNGQLLWKDFEITVDLVLAIVILIVASWVIWMLPWAGIVMVVIAGPTVGILLNSAITRAYLLGRVSGVKDMKGKEEENGKD